MASIRKPSPSPAADTLPEDTTAAPPTPEPAKAEEKAAPVAPEPKPAPKAETKAAQPPPPPPAPTTRTYRVWKHGTLQRNGKTYEPGAELVLPPAEAAKISCLELVN